MNNITKVVAVAAIAALSTIATKSNAQQTATDGADAHATIVTPIDIVKVDDMNFGNIAVNASGGTVVLPPTGPRAPTGGVTLPSTIGTVSAASFTVSGEIGYIYAITLPASITINDGGSNNMSIGNIVSSPTVAAGGTLSGAGTQTLYVGGELTVAGAQATGEYNSTTAFDVTVVYN